MAADGHPALSEREEEGDMVIEEEVIDSQLCPGRSGPVRGESPEYSDGSLKQVHVSRLSHHQLSHYPILRLRELLLEPHQPHGVQGVHQCQTKIEPR